MTRLRALSRHLSTIWKQPEGRWKSYSRKLVYFRCMVRRSSALRSASGVTSIYFWRVIARRHGRQQVAPRALVADQSCIVHRANSSRLILSNSRCPAYRMISSTALRFASGVTSIYFWVVDNCLCPASSMMVLIPTEWSAKAVMNPLRPEWLVAPAMPASR